MLTFEDIQPVSVRYGEENPYRGTRYAFMDGARYANDENEKHLATLRAENARLREALETALAEGMKTRAGRDVVRNALDFELPDRL